MINGIGVVGWGVGGIEAEAAMLGQPVYMLTPDVVGFELTGKLREGVTATDLVLYVTEILRREKVVGQVRRVLRPRRRRRSRCPTAPPSATWRPSTAPRWASSRSTEMTLAYFQGTGRTEAEIERFEAYYKAQGLFGMPAPGAARLHQGGQARPGHASRPAWPARSARRTASTWATWPTKFAELYSKPNEANGFNQPADKLRERFPCRPQRRDGGARS